MRILFILVMLGLPLSVQAGEIYKWRDKNGNIHYSDVEPDNQAAKRKEVKAKDPVRVPPTEKEVACQRGRANLAALTDPINDTVMMDLNQDGVAEEITSEQRDRQIKAMQAVITANCTN